MNKLLEWLFVGLVELKLMEIVHKALDKSGDYIEQHSKEIDNALSAIQESIMQAENELRKEFEHVLVDINKGLWVSYNYTYN